MNPLSQLRDIHYPTLYGFWPIAIGWYFVFLLALLVMYVVNYVWKLREKRVKLRREAIRKLQQLRTRYETDGDIVSAAIELSMLLRRAALAKFPQKDVASLHDVDWLNFLDQSGQTDAFTVGAGKVLVSAPYQRNTDFSAVELFTLVDEWIRKNLEDKKKK